MKKFKMYLIFVSEYFLVKIIPSFIPSRKRRHSYRMYVVGKYFKHRYLPMLANRNIEDKPVRNKQDTIFQLWLQGAENAPPLVKACFDTVEKFKENRKHIIINEKTLGNFVDLPPYIMDKYHAGRINKANFSDAVRLELLHNFGGYWMDSTDYMTDKIPEVIDNAEFFVFHTRSDMSFFQNCFIKADKGAFLLDAWRELTHLYWQNEIKAIDYFFQQHMLEQLVFNNATANKLYKEMPNLPQGPTHMFYDIYNKPYDEKLFLDRIKYSFFQKLTYRWFWENLPKDSLAMHLAKM